MTVRSRVHSSFQGASSWEAAAGGEGGLPCSPQGASAPPSPSPPCAPPRAARPSPFRLTAKAVAVLLPILGTSWVFGVLAVNRQAVVFQYVFALLNSLQVGAPGRPQVGMGGAGRPRAGGTGGTPLSVSL